jgi:hypothetical protein
LIPGGTGNTIKPMFCIRGINLEFNLNKVARIGIDTLDVPAELSMGFKTPLSNSTRDVISTSKGFLLFMCSTVYRNSSTGVLLPRRRKIHFKTYLSL